jgi:hypothetical protein
MPIHIADRTLHAGKYTIALADIPAQVRRYERKIHATRPLEEKGARLREAGVSTERLAAFIRAVCRWGGYSGIGGRILKHNKADALQMQFEATIAALSRPDPDLCAALGALNRLYGLGRPSFASKHLRFLDPALCPILDSLLADNLVYPANRERYLAFAGDCHKVVSKLQQLGITNLVERPSGNWYAADVEKALFVVIRFGPGTGSVVVPATQAATSSLATPPLR